MSEIRQREIEQKLAHIETCAKVKNFRNSIYSEDLRGCVSDLRRMLCGELRTLPWPDEPGLWLGSHPDGKTFEAMAIHDCHTGRILVRALTKSPTDPVIQSDPTVDRQWRYTGPLPYIIPDLPNPSIWDYQPQAGDWVRVKDDLGEELEPIYPIRRDQHTPDMRLAGYSGRHGFNSPTVDVARRKGYRFAKAEVTPPPATEE